MPFLGAVLVATSSIKPKWLDSSGPRSAGLEEKETRPDSLILEHSKYRVQTQNEDVHLPFTTLNEKESQNPQVSAPCLVAFLYIVGTHSCEVALGFCPFLPVGGLKHGGLCKCPTNSSICTITHRTLCENQRKGGRECVVMEILSWKPFYYLNRHLF